MSVQAFASEVMAIDVVTPWSESAIVEAGLLKPDDWSASFITAARRIGPDGPLQPLRFRKQFHLDTRRVGHARLYLTPLGLVKAYINGQLNSDEEMAPGWTSYRRHVNYRVHDVTALLKSGSNVISAEAAEGWYAGVLGIRGGTRFISGGKDIAILAQLEVFYDDDTMPEPTILTSNQEWSCTGSSIQLSDLQRGRV
ncbi:alpha-L-rhamnosidase N-terminal domain-containing protein [Xylariaceae sp. FL0662B]|nr:alpha-L-rhamnosidase N-terminal domain-containing protein [Xylariaceae sp. FL0662B]